MKRRHDDSIKHGKGIDGSLGERYSKQYAVDPWHSNVRGDFLSPKGAGKYQEKDASFLRNQSPTDIETQHPDSEARDIWNAVEGQSSDSGNRRVRSGDRD